MTLAVVVGVAGALGAVARYLLDGAVQGRTRATFPFGTLMVNVAGSFILGVLTGLALYHGLTRAPKAVIGAGFCGGFTTWSTASWETVRLAEDGAVGAALCNGLGGLLATV
ncbi:MAG TPA: CrcB family protein, partial [Acidimicrobiales bacterium]|nr:CrcB family protein [Acidimicrobiales bacterium]